MYQHDNRIVITLDAGGTNFVFGAMQSNQFIVNPLTVPSNAHNLDLCLKTMVDGFRRIISQLPDRPVAISFAFPGPADYPNGIIGGYLPNFPSFRDGVALGPFLEETFGIPVFINNDGDLFAYGEALGGVLPEVNARLRDMGCNKQFHNLIGYTFGTGFGMGSVINGQLNRGDNSCVETWCLPHKKRPDLIVEEGVAVRAVKRCYSDFSGIFDPLLEPKDIFDIAEGKRDGDANAARRAFAEMGEVAGYAMASAATMMDGLVVIGGGITAASKYFMPSLLEEMRGRISTLRGDRIDRVQMRVFDLDNDGEFETFARGEQRELKVYGTDRSVIYDPMKRIGVMISKLGASRAISVGAYAFALNRLDADNK